MSTVGRLQDGKLKIVGEIEEKQGKNLFNGIFYEGFINITTGVIGADALYPNSLYSDKIYVTGGATYTCSGYTPADMRFRMWKIDGSYLGSVSAGAGTATVPSNAYYIRLLWYNGLSDRVDVQFELGDTATAYEAYVPDPTLHITPSGEVKIGGTIVEQPDIPSDVYYYPLTFDGKDITHTFSPSAQSNLVFSRDGVWVGTATQNYYTGFDPYANNGGSIVDVSNTEGEFGFLASVGAKTYKLIKDGTGNQWNGFQGTYGNWITGASGAGFTASGYCKTTDNANAELGAFEAYSTDWVTKVGDNTVNIGLGSPLQDDKWNYFSSTCILNQAYTGAIGATLPNWGYSTEAGSLYLHGMMWEKKPFASPFCATTRGAGKLQFNFNSTLGLDWNGDWTICYWKKPVGTSDDTMNYYSIESLGCSSNSVGGGYSWWGKPPDNSCIEVCPSYATQTYTNYFNKWHMISVTKSGTLLTWKFWGIDGTTITKTYTSGTIASNYYLTQYGYDFSLGGYNNSNPPNTYYKDLVVAKRALTDAELISIYKTQMKSYNSSGILQLRSEISEGDLLL